MTKQKELEANFKTLKAKEAIEKEQARIDNILSQLGENLESSPEFVLIGKIQRWEMRDPKFISNIRDCKTFKIAKLFQDKGYEVYFHQPPSNVWSCGKDETFIFIPKTSDYLAKNRVEFSIDNLIKAAEENKVRIEEVDRQIEKGRQAKEGAKFWNKVKNFFK